MTPTRSRALLSVTAAVVLAGPTLGCGEAPEGGDAVETTGQAISGFELMATMFETSLKIQRYLEGDRELRDIHQQIDRIAWQFGALKEEVKVINRRLDEIELETTYELVEGHQRTAIASRVNWLRGEDFQPGAVNDAFTAALNLENLRLYEFTTRNTGTRRFDPRVAGPPFVEAVVTWLALQNLIRVNGQRVPLSFEDRRQLHKFGDRLLDTAQNIRRNVRCEKGETTSTREVGRPCRRPGEDSCPERVVCERWWHCTDNMELPEARFTGSMQVVNGACAANWSDRDRDAEARILTKYIPWEYERLIPIWREMAKR